ncbi:MAG TPA: transketolase C-terminal domain-containing protein, partial [Sphingobacteriaceae bacterium]
RFGRPVIPVFTDENQRFEIGKAWKIRDGKDVSVFATGHLVWEAIQAVEILENDGIDVELINIHTIKPLDETAILESVAKTGCAVSAEEHNRLGGLGDSIAQTLIRHNPAPLEYVAVDDSFGESGKPADLMKKYGLDAENIVRAVRAVMKRKSRKYSQLVS